MLYVVTIKKKMIIDAASTLEAIEKAKTNEIIKEDESFVSVKPITNSEKIWYGVREVVEE